MWLFYEFHTFMKYLFLICLLQSVPKKRVSVSKNIWGNPQQLLDQKLRHYRLNSEAWGPMTGRQRLGADQLYWQLFGITSLESRAFDLQFLPWNNEM